jgi:hypothetical protein
MDSESSTSSQRKSAQISSAAEKKAYAPATKSRLRTAADKAAQAKAASKNSKSAGGTKPSVSSNEA